MIAIILLGAFAGAALLPFGPSIPLLLAALLTLVVAAIEHVSLRRPILPEAGDHPSCQLG
ncbi:hypothetical protein JNB63_18485 [Microbacterium trichothecenolyticum]|nr:hypothetical protein [Microbacterium trichothecenolyticum]